MTNITVYSTPTCPWCQKLKSWLKEKNVDFKDVNVAEDQDAMKTLVEKSGQMGVPQTEINGKIIVGFDEETLQKELDNDSEKKTDQDSEEETKEAS